MAWSTHLDVATTMPTPSWPAMAGSTPPRPLASIHQALVPVPEDARRTLIVESMLEELILHLTVGQGGKDLLREHPRGRSDPSESCSSANENTN